MIANDSTDRTYRQISRIHKQAELYFTLLTTLNYTSSGGYVKALRNCKTKWWVVTYSQNITILTVTRKHAVRISHFSCLLHLLFYKINATMMFFTAATTYLSDLCGLKQTNKNCIFTSNVLFISSFSKCQ